MTETSRLLFSMHRGRNHGEHRMNRQPTERTQRTDHRPGARQVSMNTRTHSHTPEGEKLKKAIRIINHIITATHHLQNVTHSRGAPAALARKTGINQINKTCSTHKRYHRTAGGKRTQLGIHNNTYPRKTLHSSIRCKKIGTLPLLNSGSGKSIFHRKKMG